MPPQASIRTSERAAWLHGGERGQPGRVNQGRDALGVIGLGGEQWQAAQQRQQSCPEPKVHASAGSAIAAGGGGVERPGCASQWTCQPPATRLGGRGSLDDLFEFLVGLDVVAKIEPALGGLQVLAVWRFKLVHLVEGLSSGSPPRTRPRSAPCSPVEQPNHLIGLSGPWPQVAFP